MLLEVSRAEKRKAIGRLGILCDVSPIGPKNVKSAMRKSRGREDTVRVTDTRVFVDVSGVAVVQP